METEVFDVAQTHGILVREGISTQTRSDAQGWRSLYAASQHEQPYEARFASVRDHLIVLHLDGPVAIERDLHQGSGRCLIPQGGMHMIPGGTDFRVKLCGALSTLHLYVRDEVLREIAAECLPGDPAALELLPRFGDTDPMLEHLLHAVRDVLEDGHPATACYADHLARAVAARLIRRHSNRSEHAPYEQAPRDLLGGELARAIAFMRANLGRSIDLRDIASATRHSPGHFARRFRQSIGLAPHQYLLRLRTGMAQHLLAETGRPIAEIAFECGFANQEHLTRFFKRAVGATPAAYRRQRRS
jgi:AraC family transcriptional regulator